MTIYVYDPSLGESLDETWVIKVSEDTMLDAKIEYGPPAEPPLSGSDWDPLIDLPYVIGKLTLPVTENRRLREDLRCPQVEVMGETLNLCWGHYGTRSHAFGTDSWTRGVAEMREYLHAEANKIRLLLLAREVRMAQRARTLAAALRA